MLTEAKMSNTAKNEPLTEERIAEIKARAEAATPGPWYHVLSAIVGTTTRPDDDNTTCICNTEWGNATNVQPNAEFIAHAREDVPALLEEVERLLARGDWLITHILEKDLFLCPMTKGHKCEQRYGVMCCLDSSETESRRQCWRKAADMATRENPGESG